MRPKRIAMAALGIAAIASPAVTQAKNHEHGGIPLAEQVRTHDPKSYEKEYLKTYDRVAEELGFAEAGRNLVVDGYRENDGDTRDASEKEIVEGTETLDATLTAATAPEAATETATTETATTDVAATGGGYASSSTVACESGGDYSAVNPAGYYGAYQFDQSTWDAYAPEGYAGTNPAEAPPEVQDAAAANVPYDAWPNC
jgi:hypothetical protein